MFRLPICFLYSITFFMFLCATVSGQAQSIDSSTNNTALLKDAYDIYSSLFKENSRVYNGSSFSGYYHRINGHPFFGSAKLENGSVLYDGIVYPGINVAYDIVQDQVIINHYNQQFDIQLIPEKIQGFSIGEHRFVRILSDTINGAGMNTGFYESVYENDATVLVKRTKKIEYPQRADDSTRFVQYDFYFVRMEDVYHSIYSKRSLFRLFGKNKNEVKKHLRKNSLSFKRNAVAMIIEAMKYHHELTN